MKFIQIDHNPAPRQLHIFGALWLLFFAVIGGVLLKHGGFAWVAMLVWGIAVIVPAVGSIMPRFMRVVYVGMAYAAFPVGVVVSLVIMVVVYYLLLTPIGLVLRMCGYDPMNRHFDRGAETYWRPHEHENSLDTYFRQF